LNSCPIRKVCGIYLKDVIHNGAWGNREHVRLREEMEGVMSMSEGNHFLNHRRTIAE